MRKYHVAVLLVLAFILGTMAGVGGFAQAEQQIKVYVNGKELASDPPLIIQNDRIFVPLRAVSETLGAKVAWDYYRQAAFIATYSDPVNIEIVGTEEFKKGMEDALNLLKTKSPDDYEFIGMYTKRIELDTREIVKNPHAGAYNMTTYIPRSFKPDPYWWAGILRHEAQHSQQIYRANDDVAVVEPEAYEAGLKTLITIGAPQYMIDYEQKALDKKAWQN